jgi:dimeric dUTPase (all-alpha-NTP-PPase superfamily)
MYISEEQLFKKLQAAGFDLKKPIHTSPEMSGNTYTQEEEHMMNLSDFLNLQAGLDRIILDRVSESGRQLTESELLNCRFLGLFTETGEFCNELGVHKYWKLGHKIDEEKALTEFADVLFFIFSIANLKGYTAEQIQDAYMAKWNENIKRQKNNY